MKHLFTFILILLSSTLGLTSNDEAIGNASLTLSEYSENQAHSDKNQLSLNDISSNEMLFKAKLTISLPDGWHIYSNKVDGIGLPTAVNWIFTDKQKQTLSILNESWPPPTPFSVGAISGKGYEKTTTISFTFKSTSKIDLSDLKLKASVSWLACNDTCIPENQTVKAIYQGNAPPTQMNQKGVQQLENGNKKNTVHKENQASLGKTKTTNSSLVKTLSFFIFAFIGGLILNLMPCVFPVLSIKLFSLIKHSQSPKDIRTQSIYFVLGILSVFWIFSLLIIVFQSLSYSIGWGFHLQSPITIVFLLILFFLMGLNFFGLFEIGLNLTSVQTKQTSSKASSFLSGCLTTIVATPCTAPFMGTALGATLTAHPIVTFLIFTFLGLGLAFPFILLPFFPSFYKHLPKPGAWMEQVKQFFGFPMMATSVWLLYVLTAQTYDSIWTSILLALTLLAMAGWVFGIFQKSQKKWQLVSAIIIAALSIFFTIQNLVDKEYAIWETYTSETQQTYEKSGQSYFIDITADWCITCKVNEKHIVAENVLSEFKRKNVKLIKADWTLKNSEITELLNKHGRNGVPLYIFYNGETKKTSLLPQLITKSTILKKLKELN
ncbi:hypothetical protein HOG98_06140 [bacterium]|jgi:thiol:disulfide interchange protein|nr:hypothetical protein [bacterium]